MTDEQAQRKANKIVEKRQRSRSHQIDEVDRELLRLKLRYPTRTLTELAENVGLKYTQTIKRVNREEFQLMLRAAQLDAIGVIKEAKIKAARRIVKLVDSENEMVALKAAQMLCADILPALNVKHSGEVKHMIETSPEQERERIKTIIAELGGVADFVGAETLLEEARAILQRETESAPVGEADSGCAVGDPEQTDGGQIGQRHGQDDHSGGNGVDVARSIPPLDHRDNGSDLDAGGEDPLG